MYHKVLCMPRPLYIEARIRGPLDRLWQYTQDPTQHERWDLRFSTIRYLPRPDPRQPQRFRYTTRIGLGLAISGEGETVGERTTPSGQRTSALSFWSDAPYALIRRGTGYWKYIPTDDGVRFVTQYDYEVRFGAAGRLVDRCVFRPLMGWATAWSFDRLRLWVERDQSPETSRRRALQHAAASGTLVLVATTALGAWHRASSFAARAALGGLAALAFGGIGALLGGVGAQRVPLARRCGRRRPGGGQ